MNIQIVILFIAIIFWQNVMSKDSEESVINSPQSELWNAWKKKYEKTYESIAEEKDRFDKFINNMDKVNLHNTRFDMGLETYNTELNSFADLSWDEFESIYLGSRQQLRVKSSSEDSTKDHAPIDAGKADVNDLPASVDWREKGYVTGVKNQGQCGSCWAFSTTGGLEGQHFNATGTLVSLSEQQLVSCDDLCYGCGGGWVEKGYDYLRKKGSISEADYPYNSQWGFNHDCEEEGKPIAATVNKYISLPSGNEQSLQAASATVGPISVAIDASGLFEFYKSGVYYSKWCDPNYLDHAVLVVGYGTYQSPDNNQTDPQDYWLVKNSWGTRWGLDGYIMMSRNRDNNCGIASDALYPIV